MILGNAETIRQDLFSCQLSDIDDTFDDDADDEDYVDFPGEAFDDDADEGNADDEDYVDFPGEVVKRAAEP